MKQPKKQSGNRRNKKGRCYLCGKEKRLSNLRETHVPSHKEGVGLLICKPCNEKEMVLAKTLPIRVRQNRFEREEKAITEFIAENVQERVDRLVEEILEEEEILFLDDIFEFVEEFDQIIKEDPEEEIPSWDNRIITDYEGDIK